MLEVLSVTAMLESILDAFVLELFFKHISAYADL